MEVERAGKMGPERILPNSEDELGQERPSEGGLPEVGGEWIGDDMEEDEGEGPAEEGEENGDNGGYYYQPLNQDPDGLNGVPAEEDTGSQAEQLQDVQERIEAMGLHLPHAPPPDSDEEAEPEGVVVEHSHASIPMDADHVELVKRTMAAVALPSLGVPAWAQDISDDQWKDMVQQTLDTRQSSAGFRLHSN